MIDKQEFNLFKKLFLFENRFQEKKATYFSITNEYIWRRDDVRLTAYQLETPVKGNYNYQMSDLPLREEDVVEDLTIDEKGVLTLTKEGGEQHSIEPVDVPLEPNALETLTYPTFHSHVAIKSKPLVRYLLMQQRKLLNSDGSLEECTLCLDFDNGHCIIEETNEKQPFEYEIKKKGETNKMFFSFLLFKDFLIQGNSFSKEINFFSFTPYFSLIQYTDKVYTVLNHKRNIQAEA